MSNCPIIGLIHVTGQSDTGKSTFAYTAGPSPNRIAFFDNDIKGKSVHADLNFGLYVNLVREFTQGRDLKPIAFYRMVMRYLDEIEENQFDLIVFDNWTQMEGGINAYAEAHILEMSDLSAAQARGMSQLTWPAKRAEYARVLDAFLAKAPTVVITTHVKNKWVGKVRTEQMVPQCQMPLMEKSSLRLWLVHNPDSQAPIGLVLKRASKSYWSEELGKIKIDPILPRRIKPATWDKIGWYLENPIGDRALTPDEIPNEWELSILDGVLTADQKMMMELAMKGAGEEEDEVEIPEPQEAEDRSEDVQRLVKEGKKAGEIAKELGLNMVEVRRMM